MKLGKFIFAALLNFTLAACQSTSALNEETTVKTATEKSLRYIN